MDAWIGNGDRHHENWGVISKKVVSSAIVTIYLAPTYDHASCLGRELSDEKRQKCLVEAYANKCASAFFSKVGDKKPLKTFDVFIYVALKYPYAANIWLERLGTILPIDILDIFSRIPKNCISPVAADFAQKILELNQTRLFTLREKP